VTVTKWITLVDLTPEKTREGALKARAFAPKLSARALSCKSVPLNPTISLTWRDFLLADADKCDLSQYRPSLSSTELGPFILCAD